MARAKKKRHATAAAEFARGGALRAEFSEGSADWRQICHGRGVEVWGFGGMEAEAEAEAEERRWGSPCMRRTRELALVQVPSIGSRECEQCDGMRCEQRMRLGCFSAPRSARKTACLHVGDDATSVVQWLRLGEALANQGTAALQADDVGKRIKRDACRPCETGVSCFPGTRTHTHSHALRQHMQGQEQVAMLSIKSL